uniref:Uncharacterized protein n=1 Tax=Solibacter usitatus (strain Ellin6076) TaxID=234267 RepID=Q020G4_SOLUE
MSRKAFFARDAERNFSRNGAKDAKKNSFRLKFFLALLCGFVSLRENALFGREAVAGTGALISRKAAKPQSNAKKTPKFLGFLCDLCAFARHAFGFPY